MTYNWLKTHPCSTVNYTKQIMTYHLKRLTYLCNPWTFQESPGCSSGCRRSVHTVCSGVCGGRWWTSHCSRNIPYTDCPASSTVLSRCPEWGRTRDFIHKEMLWCLNVRTSFQSGREYLALPLHDFLQPLQSSAELHSGARVMIAQRCVWFSAAIYNHRWTPTQ